MAADFTIKAHDRLPAIQAELSTDAGLANLTGATVRFIMAPAVGGTPKVNANASVLDPTQGSVRYEWVAADTASPGSYLAEWQVTWSDGRQQTFPTLTYHTVDVLADLDGV